MSVDVWRHCPGRVGPHEAGENSLCRWCGGLLGTATDKPPRSTWCPFTGCTTEESHAHATKPDGPSVVVPMPPEHKAGFEHEKPTAYNELEVFSIICQALHKLKSNESRKRNLAAAAAIFGLDR